jgi:pyruvate dehydrogenase phosphatase
MDGNFSKASGEDVDNAALVVLRHALMGGREDSDRLAQMLTVEIPWRWMDDTTVLVQRF